jgi:hypothetical protein
MICSSAMLCNLRTVCISTIACCSAAGCSFEQRCKALCVLRPQKIETLGPFGMRVSKASFLWRSFEPTIQFSDRHRLICIGIKKGIPWLSFPHYYAGRILPDCTKILRVSSQMTSVVALQEIEFQYLGRFTLPKGGMYRYSSLILYVIYVLLNMYQALTIVCYELVFPKTEKKVLRFLQV